MWMRFADQGGSPPDPPTPKPGEAAHPEATEPDGMPTYQDEVNTTLLAILPWAISVLMHVGLVILALFLVWSIISTAEEEEVIVPVVDLSQTPGAPVQVQQQQRETSQSQSSRQRVIQTTSQSTSQSISEAVSVSAGGLGDPAAASSSSPFSSTGATSAQFETQFFGAGGNARRIVYLVDASGSLIDTLPFVLDELSRSINQLSEQQQFTVIFFKGEGVIEVPPAGLRQADAANKSRVIEWIKPTNNHIQPEFRTNPIMALRQALQYRPQLIFLLSDNITGSGRYQVDQSRMLEQIEQTNSAGTKINTIQFLYPDQMTRLGLKGTMEEIADQTGGTYKFVDQDEMNYNIERR